MSKNMSVHALSNLPLPISSTMRHEGFTSAATPRWTDPRSAALESLSRSSLALR